MNDDVFVLILVIDKQWEISTLTMGDTNFYLPVIMTLRFLTVVIFFYMILGYDRYIKLWDTETGQVVARFNSRKIPYCIKFNPDKNKQHLFVAGTSDKKIICVSVHLVRKFMFTQTRLRRNDYIF